MDKESTVQELTRSLVLPRTREDTFTITMEATFIMEGMDTTTMFTSRALVMEEMAINNISILPHR